MSRKRLHNLKKFKPLRSGLERKHYEQLKASGIGFEYETEKLEYRKRVVKGICPKCGCTDVYQRKTYIPDWILENGIRIESKGRLDSQNRTKLVAVQQQHKDLDLRLVFGANNKINKKKDKRYMAWAAENGFRAAVGEIPASWMKKKEE